MPNDDFRQTTIPPSGLLRPRPGASVPAPLGRRTLAAMLDGFIIHAFTTVVVSPLVHSSFPVVLTASALNLLTAFVYAGYFYIRHSATPGKLALGLKVVKEGGQNLDFVEAGLRDGVGKWMSTLVLGIGYLMAFVRDDRRTLHDVVFKTLVIRTEGPRQTSDQTFAQE